MFQYSSFGEFILANVPGMLCGLVINLTFAVVYKLKVVNKAGKLSAKTSRARTDFDPGLNDCIRDRHMCLHVCFFHQCRVAHTWHVAGLLSYWPAVFVQACCGPCVGGYMRAELKRKMGMKADTGAECRTVLASQCCAIGQEAMAVDAELGVKTQCCCQLKPAEPVAYPQQEVMATIPGGVSTSDNARRLPVVLGNEGEADTKAI